MSKRLIKTISLTVLLVMVTFLQSFAQVEHTKKLNKLTTGISKENILVLLRLRPVIIAEERPLLGGYKPTSREPLDATLFLSGFAIKIRAAQGGQATKIITFASPGRWAESQGWIYVTLPPGNYFVNLIWREGGGSWAGGRDLSPAYAIEIPQSHPVTYIGSFKIDCKSKLGGNLSRVLTDCSRVEMKDETSEALNVARTYLEQYGLPAISLAHEK